MLIKEFTTQLIDPRGKDEILNVHRCDCNRDIQRNMNWWIRSLRVLSFDILCLHIHGIGRDTTIKQILYTRCPLVEERAPNASSKYLHRMLFANFSLSASLFVYTVYDELQHTASLLEDNENLKVICYYLLAIHETQYSHRQAHRRTMQRKTSVIPRASLLWIDMTTT